MINQEELKDALVLILDEELPWYYTCPYCEREFDSEIETGSAVEQIADLITKTIKRGLGDTTASASGGQSG